MTNATQVAAEVGARIRQLRADETQVVFGSRFGVGQVAVSYWEKGQALPKAEVLIGLIQLGLDLTDIPLETAR